jgi:UDP-glucose 4-epimerase
MSADDIEILASVELIIHAGAYTPKNASEANAVSGCNENITFTEQLLGLPTPKLRKIIYLSTLDVYTQATPVNEATPAIPASLYGYSKLYCEKMIECFAKEQSAICQILRVGHVYGPGEEKYGKVLPNTIKSIIAKDSVELWGDGSEIRSFIYVDDVVTAILNSVPIEENMGVINIAGSHSVSIRQLIDQLISISGKSVVIRVREFNGPKRDLTFDTEKMHTHLLNCETDFSTGLKIEYDHIESQL